MNDFTKQQRMDSAKLIKGFCHENAKYFGIESLEVTFAEDFVTSTKETHIVTFKANSGVTQVPLSRQELEDYQGKVGIAGTNARLRRALQKIGPE